MVRKLIVACIVLVLATGSIISASGQGVAGRRGRVYTYRDDGLGVDIRVTVPDSNLDVVVRGAILDGGNNVADLDQMAFASQFGFGIGGILGGGSSTYSNGVAAAVFAAFDAWAELDNGARPEFARIPIITTGCSAGGRAAYGVGMYAPERTLCMGINVSAGYSPSNPSNDQIKVPAMFTIGEVDPLVVSANAFCDQLIKAVRARGGLWSEAVIWGMSHETRRINHMFAAFYERCINQCYPASVNPRTGPVVLVRPTEQSGWLAPQQSVQESNFTTIAPYNSFAGDKATASWLLDEEIARLYRGYTSKDIRITFSTPDTFAWSGVGPGGVPLDGPYWWAINCYQPGETIDLIVKDSTRIPGWTKIELYDGATLIDSLLPGQPMRFSVTAAAPVVHAFNLLAYDNTTRVYPSVLFSVFVSPWTPTYDPPSSTAVLPRQVQPAQQTLRLLPDTRPSLYSLTGRSLSVDAAPWGHMPSPTIARTTDRTVLRLLGR
jgi:hypothetical protein